MKMYGEWSAFLTSALDGDEWSASCPSQFTSGTELLICYLLVRMLFGLHCRSGCCGEKETLSPDLQLNSDSLLVP